VRASRARYPIEIPRSRSRRDCLPIRARCIDTCAIKDGPLYYRAIFTSRSRAFECEPSTPRRDAKSGDADAAGRARFSNRARADARATHPRARTPDENVRDLHHLHVRQGLGQGARDATRERRDARSVRGRARVSARVFEDARARLARADARTRDRGRANDWKESFAAGGRAMREVARSRDERRAIARAPRERAVDRGWDARREGLTNARSRARAGAIPRSPDEGVRGAPGAVLRGEVLRERGGGACERSEGKPRRLNASDNARERRETGATRRSRTRDSARND
jgi:hypothetical protein